MCGVRRRGRACSHGATIITDGLPKEEKKYLDRDFLENEKSYWEVRENLLQRYSGKWVAVREGEVVAEAENVFEILDRAEEVGGHPYIVRVGHEDMEIHIRRIFSYDADYQPFPLPRIAATFSDRHRNRSASYEDVIPDTGADISLLPERDGAAIGLRAYPYLALARPSALSSSLSKPLRGSWDGMC